MICLRPHHGMCLAYFEGKGYSDGFTVNMQKMLEFFEKGADIELTVSGDEICKECPNLKEGSCVSAGLVEAYDRKVLEACGLSEKVQMRFQEFVENVQKNVRRRLLCNYLAINESLSCDNSEKDCEAVGSSLKGWIVRKEDFE
mgnify:CR=1 FL=1